VTCNRLEDEDLLAELGGTLDEHAAHCPDCSERLRGYEQIAALLADGATDHRAPPGWKQRTLARVHIDPRRRRRRRTAIVSALVGVAAVGLLLVLLPRFHPDPDHPSGTPQLDMQFVDGGGWRGEAHPGEDIRARARPAGAAYFEIRVYRGARDLLVRCPGAGPSVCLEIGGSLLVWKVPSVGTYQVVLLTSQQPIAAPRGSLDADVAIAIAAGARASDVETIHVH
jgi:hypothetical protein